MKSFSVITEIKGEAKKVASEVLTMAGVNYELMPIVRMTAPKYWRNTPIFEWPTGDKLFKSNLLIFGIIPIDIHRFGLIETGLNGINESSDSMIMRSWNHMRRIEGIGDNTLITDIVEFEPRIRLLGAILAPIYRLVFHHRHKRLSKRYGLES